MEEKSTTTARTTFEEDVLKGLTDYPKHISSQYFYDEKGDALFRDIMNMPGYYLTDSEYEILERHKEDLYRMFSGGRGKFNLVELGAGDGRKTRILLEYFTGKRLEFKYIPVDISRNALGRLSTALKRELPDLEVDPLPGTYVESLEYLANGVNGKKVILFLGSNIGNLLHPQAIAFLRDIQQLMGPEDLLFIGFDQKKDPRTVLQAYNDAQGITAAFNKNVLARINRELRADFDLDEFSHWEVYDPETGTAKSFLISRKPQTVFIEALDLEVAFQAWETIHTEISQKYDHETIHWLALKAGLRPVTHFSDRNGYYRNYVFKSVKDGE